MSILDEVGSFIKLGNDLWFIETLKGNYVWFPHQFSDGDNILIQYDGSLYKYMSEHNIITTPKDKGKHVICKYCGNVKIISDDFTSAT